MRILFLPKYCESGPSSRYRFYQYLPLLDKQGILYDIRPLFNDRFIEGFYRNGKKNIFVAVISFFRRFFVLFTCFRYDLLVIEYELFPFFPPIFERILGFFRKRYIVDYDDAIFANYESGGTLIVRKLLGKKTGVVMSNAVAVTAGNKYLMDYALRYNREVCFIPTVVSSNKYTEPGTTRSSDRFIVGWIGSPTSVRYLKLLRNVFASLNPDEIEIKLVGVGRDLPEFAELSGINYVNWRSDTEIDEIRNFSAGIMPLADDPWTRGKSGFKLIQYMACGLPVIASKVGANCEIVEDGVTGFLVETTEEWIKAINYLKQNPDIASVMGKRGYERFLKHYSLEAVSTRLINLLISMSD